MRNRRPLAAALLAVVALALAACSGLPHSGPVRAGLALDSELDELDFTQLAPGPVPGATPAQTVDGFIDAAITPTDNWGVARQFLTTDFAESWAPLSAVTIDESGSGRTTTSDVEDDDEQATTAQVSVIVDQVAGVDRDGVYTSGEGAARLDFELAREDTDAEWRITHAPDGIVLDVGSFSQVFTSYDLKFFDPSWKRLVPDVRWFPRRAGIPTTLTRALISGGPSSWIAPAVRNAFTEDVLPESTSVVVSGDQVAEVELSAAALSLDDAVLARMRTQLEASLESIGVSRVQFVVGGRQIDAGTVDVEKDSSASPSLVLTDDRFGEVVGDEITELGGISAQIEDIADPVTAVDVSDNNTAAVRIADSGIYRVTDGQVDLLDDRPGLIDATIDPYGYIWTVPQKHPHDLSAWNADIVEHQIADAWPSSTSITQMRVSADGARVVALTTAGGEHRVEVASVIRDEDGVPTALASPYVLDTVDDSATGLAWLDGDQVAVLVAGDAPQMITMTVGGPTQSVPAPGGSRALAGAEVVTGLRILDADGTLFVRRGSSWQESMDGVRVLGTRAGR